MDSNPKFPYEIKWLVIHYATGSIDDDTFKGNLKALLTQFPMDSEYSATCLCKYILEQEKYGPLSEEKVKHIADLIYEIDSFLGRIVQDWVKETYGE